MFPNWFSAGLTPGPLVHTTRYVCRSILSQSHSTCSCPQAEREQKSDLGFVHIFLYEPINRGIGQTYISNGRLKLHYITCIGIHLHTLLIDSNNICKKKYTACPMFICGGPLLAKAQSPALSYTVEKKVYQPILAQQRAKGHSWPLLGNWNLMDTIDIYAESFSWCIDQT